MTTDSSGTAPLARVAMTGASGLVGSAASALLRDEGTRVDALVRRAPRAGSTEIRWDPARGEVDRAGLEGVDAVVHLAGESVVAERWTEAHKREIRESRVRGTDVLCRALAGLERAPRVLISASAVGFYGDRGDEVLTEESPAGAGFLADVCRGWEAAVEPARAAGIRVVVLRVGIVLAEDGGALAKMVPMFRAGAGGTLGSGKQWISWIARRDLARVIRYLLTADTVAGTVNGVGPQPVTNAEFGKTLGRVVHRPAIAPVPAFVLKMMLGEMAEEMLLASQRVLPKRLEGSGFTFEFPDLESALRAELSP